MMSLVFLFSRRLLGADASGWTSDAVASGMVRRLANHRQPVEDDNVIPMSPTIDQQVVIKNRPSLPLHLARQGRLFSA